MASYTIKAGDNLSRIAKQYGTTVDALAKANNISDPNKIRAGASLNIPGASTGTATGTSANNNYGTGQYGGKYMGSNTTGLYSNMENAPGSTGYEKGSVTFSQKDDEGNVVSTITKEGVLPLGTSFRATGAALADPENVPDSTGIFAYAKGRTPGYIEHVSGYTGQGYKDAKGRYYDANGNLLREDGYFYEPGATVSKNGMYQDTGSGYGLAHFGVGGSTGNTMYTKSPYYGAAPGSTLEIVDEEHGWTRGTGTSQPVQQQPDNIISQIIAPTTPAKKTLEDLERERYAQMMAQGGVW